MSNSNNNDQKDIPLRSAVLHTAANLITGQRQQDYGTPQENFQRIADFWNTHLEKKLLPGEKISPRQVAEMMMLLKIARTINSPTEDSYVDSAGYAGIAAELAHDERIIQIMSEPMESAQKVAEKIIKSHTEGYGQLR